MSRRSVRKGAKRAKGPDKIDSNSISQPRAEMDVFADIRQLVQSPGFLHALAHFVFESNFITGSGEFTKQDFLKTYDPKNLIRTEANLLIALALSADVDLTIPHPNVMQQYMDDAVRLLDELHQAILAPAHEAFLEAIKQFQVENLRPESPMKQGVFLREAIFYGAESAFPFQYEALARERYASDHAWLEGSRGFNIDEAAQAMVAIRNIVTQQNSQHLDRFKNQNPNEWTHLPDFSFTLDEVCIRSRLSSEKVIAIVNAFTTAEGDPDLNVEDTSSYNKAASYPLLLLKDGTRLAFLEYNLFESLYENPFYWIGLDKQYLGKHSQTRGAFVETFTERTLTKVFGSQHVYRNVKFLSASGDTIGEADAILKFGYRAFIVQAKSKKLTLQSRRGDNFALAKDFQSAVQDAYDQAIKCIEHIKDGNCACVNEQSLRQDVFDGVREYYPICITSEHYPALSAQVRELLKLQSAPDVAHPVVLDVFTLDVIAEMLETPLYFTDYLVKRSEAADRIIATHELIILSWYIKKNLFIKANELVNLADDVLVELDLAMAVRRAGISGPATPEGQLTRFNGTPIGRIIDLVNQSNRPDVQRLGEVLLGMDGNTADTFNRGISKVLEMTARDGKLHDITIALEGSGGVTIHCNTLDARAARQKLAAHCTMRKYSEKKDCWYGVTLTPNGDPLVMLGIEHPWREEPDLEAHAGDFRVRSVTHAFEPRRKIKVGRNELCPCGSMKKFKKCHGT